jgi:hypothetical protein
MILRSPTKNENGDIPFPLMGKGRDRGAREPIKTITPTFVLPRQGEGLEKSANDAVQTQFSKECTRTNRPARARTRRKTRRQGKHGLRFSKVQCRTPQSSSARRDPAHFTCSPFSRPERHTWSGINGARSYDHTFRERSLTSFEMTAPDFDVIPSGCEESFPRIQFKKPQTEPLPFARGRLTAVGLPAIV